MPPSPDDDSAPTSPTPLSPTDSSAPTPPTQRKARFETTLSFTNLAENEYNSTRSNSPEPLSTPSLAESYGNIRRNLSFKSLREIEAREIQRHVWRKGGRGEPGERRHRPRTYDELLSYALRGGIRESRAFPRRVPETGADLR